MTKVVEPAKGEEGVVEGEHHEGQNEVVEGNAGGDDTEDVVEPLVGAGRFPVLHHKAGSNLASDLAMDGGGGGDGEEEHVIAGVEAVPEGGDEVCEVEVERGRCAVVDVATQPEISRLVPALARVAQRLGRFVRDYTNVLDTIPLRFSCRFVNSIVTDPTHASGAFCDLPSKVVFEADPEERQPNLEVSVEPRRAGRELGVDQHLAAWQLGVDGGVSGKKEEALKEL